MFNRNEKIPTSTSGTSEPPGSKRLSFESSEKHDVIHANDKTNVSQENNEKITGNRTEPDGDHNRAGRSSSAGNVSYVYSPNRGTNGLQQRRPSIGSVTQYSVGNKQEAYLSKDQQSDLYHQTAIHGNAPSLRANHLNLLQELYLASVPVNNSSLLCGQSDKLVQFVTETPYQSQVWQCLSLTPTSRSMELNHQ